MAYLKSQQCNFATKRQPVWMSEQFPVPLQLKMLTEAWIYQQMAGSLQVQGGVGILITSGKE
ncbi:hypothetical protein OIU78_009829 [Salix suchowensis]|nr:hypothetical protein OIU78_009829 [Salix suchowensis]